MVQLLIILCLTYYFNTLVVMVVFISQVLENDRRYYVDFTEIRIINALLSEKKNRKEEKKINLGNSFFPFLEYLIWIDSNYRKELQGELSQSDTILFKWCRFSNLDFSDLRSSPVVL